MGGAWRLRAAAALWRLAWRRAPRWIARRQAAAGWGPERALPHPAARPFRRAWQDLAHPGPGGATDGAAAGQAPGREEGRP
jgi:hypothetical protein